MAGTASRAGRGTYRGDIVAGSLLLRESRQIARLLLKDPGKESWDEAILAGNILQKRSPVTARREARLIQGRLRLLTPEAWEAISSGTAEVATQFLLAAAIKHSRLLGDFMDQVVREQHRTFQKDLPNKEWDKFLETCKQSDPSIEDWKPSTVKKLRQVIFRILAEAKYIESTRSRRLLPVRVVPQVKDYLVSHNEEYVLRCMEVAQ